MNKEQLLTRVNSAGQVGAIMVSFVSFLVQLAMMEYRLRPKTMCFTAVVIFLTGCTGAKVWVKDGRTATDVDLLLCAAQQTAADMGGSYPAGTVINPTTTRGSVMDECMENKGWTASFDVDSN